MNNKLFKAACIIAVSWMPCFAEEADFYVATNGSDAWSGKVDSQISNTENGPFATLERARDAVRKLRKTKKGDITVSIRGGLYQFDETVVFGLDDSGDRDTKITYKAYPDEKPVFSSGEKLTGFKKLEQYPEGLPQEAKGKVWVKDIPKELGRFKTLYDEKGMLQRARSEGFFPEKGSARNKLIFPEGKLKDRGNVEDYEIMVRPHHAWILNVLPVVSIDEKKSAAKLSLEASYAMNKLHFLKTTPSVWVENVIDELDEPGEWALDTKKGKLYLWPRGAEPSAQTVAPQLLELIRVEGKIDYKGAKDIPVKNLHFQGLTFKHGERYTMDKDDAGLQHDWDFLDKKNALVRFRGTEGCSVDQCHFLHSGSGAIRVDLHGMNNTLSNNVIEYMGGGGILLAGYGPGTKDVNKKNLVTNNHIHHVGEIYWHSPGLFIWQSGENMISNNLIHHTNYTGLILSGCMTHFFHKSGRELGRTLRKHELGKLPKNLKTEDIKQYLHSRNNIIEYNEIHHAMQKLGDGNAIYIRGAGRNNVIRRNYIHHLVTPMIMQCAVRTDGGQEDTIFAENVIYKCTSQGIMLKLNTRCENNFVVDVIAPPRGYYISLREGPMEGGTIRNNILYSTGKVDTFISELGKNAKKTEDRRGRRIARSADSDTDFNIYYAAADIDAGKKMLKQQRLNGVDENSQSVDPMFVDPANGDFSFKPGSPAIKMGIKPIDVSKAGLKKIN